MVASMQGDKMSLVVGKGGGVTTLFKNDTLNIKVDMPTIKIPDRIPDIYERKRLVQLLKKLIRIVQKMSSDIIKILDFASLNEYRHSQSTNRTMGKDHSSNYSFDKNINLASLPQDFNSLITFKCFLESFAIDFDIKYETKQSVEGEILGNPDNFSINYKLKMQVPFFIRLMTQS